MGVDIIHGILRVGTPLCIPTKDKLLLGVVETIEANHVSL